MNAVKAGAVEHPFEVPLFLGVAMSMSRKQFLLSGASAAMGLVLPRRVWADPLPRPIPASVAPTTPAVTHVWEQFPSQRIQFLRLRSWQKATRGDGAMLLKDAATDPSLMYIIAPYNPGIMFGKTSLPKDDVRALPQVLQPLQKPVNGRFDKEAMEHFKYFGGNWPGTPYYGGLEGNGLKGLTYGAASARSSTGGFLGAGQTVTSIGDSGWPVGTAVNANYTCALHELVKDQPPVGVLIFMYFKFPASSSQALAGRDPMSASFWQAAFGPVASLTAY